MPSGKYAQPASRANPACIIFLLDQSYSMNNGIAGSPRPKIEALSTGINRFIADLITLCEKGEEKPRNYFDVGVIGYTTDRSDPPNPIVGSVLMGAGGTLAGRDLVTVSELFDDPLALRIMIDVFSERGFHVTADIHRMDVTERINPDTWEITCRSKKVYRIEVRYQPSDIRRGH